MQLLRSREETHTKRWPRWSRVTNSIHFYFILVTVTNHASASDPVSSVMLGNFKTAWPHMLKLGFKKSLCWKHGLFTDTDLSTSAVYGNKQCNPFYCLLNKH